MHVRKVVLLLLAYVAAASPCFARDANGDGYETVLLPVAFTPGVEVTGAGGARWRGELWLHNANTHAVDLQRDLFCTFNECSALYPPGYTGSVQQPLNFSPVEGGFVLVMAAADADKVTFSNRVFEMTKNARPLGVQIPVVREDQFLSRPSSFLGIPGGHDVRVALRIYDPRVETQLHTPVTPVRVDVIEVVGPAGSQQENIVASFTLTTEPVQRVATRRPGFAALYDLAAALPVIKTLQRFHVRLTPLLNNEYWAMVSVTDNVTHEFVVITPQ